MAKSGFHQCYSNNSFTFIDHIFTRTNDINKFEHFTYCSDITDHCTVGLTIKTLSVNQIRLTISKILNGAYFFLS